MESSKLIKTVKQAQSGDENALQELYLDANKSVYYLALRTVKNTEDAEDVTQEVYIAVQERISELREPAAFYKWLNQVTSNKCTDLLRRRRDYIELDDEAVTLEITEDDPLALPDRVIDDEETRRIILDVIDGLPVKQRICVMYYYYQQLTIAQIAENLGINENTVKSRLSLARAKIRAALEEKEKKEGIKLYAIPLALTPILRQAMQEFVMPEGAEARMWENISKAVSGTSANTGADQPGGSGTSGHNVQKSGIGGAGTGIAAKSMAMGVKIAIGIVAAAMIAVVAIIIPRLTETPLPAVTDTAIPAPDDTRQGGAYEGDIADGKRHGYGVWEYGRYRYEGWWENDMPNGEGMLYESCPTPENASSDDVYLLEKVIEAYFNNGFADGTVSYIWHMSDGETHRWFFKADNGQMPDGLAVYCETCGLQLILN